MKWLYQWLHATTPEHAQVNPGKGQQITGSPETGHFVNRRRELALMREMLSQICQGQGRVLLLSGEHGLGKTSLAYHFLEDCGITSIAPLEIQGSCTASPDSTISLLPIIRALQNLVVQASRQSDAQVLEIVFAGLGHTPLCDNLLGALAPAVDLYSKYAGLRQNTKGAEQLPPYQADESPGLIARLYYDLYATYKTLAAYRPLIIFVDELQWCDRKTLEFFTFFINRMRHLPVLLILAFRTVNGKPEHPELPKFIDTIEPAMASTIHLMPLQAEDVQVYVENFFPGHHFPPDLRSGFISSSGGVPLILEGIARILLETHAVTPANGSWILAPERQLGQLVLPASAEAVCNARLHYLEQTEGTHILEGLQCAAILGNVFVQEGLAELMTGLSDDKAASTEQLIRTALNHQILCKPEPCCNVAGTVYRFSHSIYQQTLYHNLSEAKKQVLHTRAGEWLEGKYQPCFPEMLLQIIRHFKAGKVYAKVAHYCYVAALQEYHKFCCTESLAYCKDGLAALNCLPKLMQAEYRVQIKLYMLMGMCLGISGEWEAAHTSYQKARRLCEEIDGLEFLPEIYWGLGHIARQQRQLTLAKEYLQQGLTPYTLEKQQVWHIPILTELATVLGASRQWQDAEKKWQEAAGLAKTLSQQWSEGNVLLELARLQEREENWQNALALYRQGVALAEQNHSLLLEGKHWSGAGRIYRKQGHWQRSLADYQEALRCFGACHDASNETRVALAIAIVTIKQGKYRQGLTLLHQLVARYDELGDRLGMAKTLNFTGRALRQSGQYEESRRYCEQAMSINKELRDESGVAYCLENLAELDALNAQSERACQTLHDVAGIWRKGGNTIAHSITLAKLGRLMASQARFDEAMDYYQQSLNLNQNLVDSKRRGEILDVMGETYLWLGLWKEASNVLQKSLEVRSKVGISGPQVITLALLGHAFRKQNRPEKALQQYQKALCICDEVEYSLGRADLWEYQGILYTQWQKFEPARQQLQNSLALRQELGDTVGTARLHVKLAKLYSKTQQYDQAHAALEQALLLQKSESASRDRIYTCNELGRLYYATGAWKDAWEHYQQALELSRRYGDTYGQARVLNNMGEVFLKQNKPLEAMEKFAQSLRLKENIHDISELFFTYRDIAQTYVQLNRFDKAIDNYQRALTYSERLNRIADSAEIRRKLGEICLKEGRESEAIQYYQRALKYYEEYDDNIAKELHVQLEELG